MSDLATAIRHLRAFQTQAEFANRVGVTRAQVSNWERGAAKPGGMSLYRLMFLGLKLPEQDTTNA